MKEKKTAPEIIVEKLIEKINETGKLPWQKPFVSKGCNYITKRCYRGLNALLLSDSEFITVNQLKEYNKKNKTDFWFKKGSQKYLATFFKKSLKRLSEEDETIIKEGGIPEHLLNAVIISENGKFYQQRIIINFYTLYDIKDIFDKNGNSLPTDSNPIQDFKNDTSAEKVIEDYTHRTGVKIVFDKQSQVYYTDKDDSVHTPPKNSYLSEEHFYRTIFHELTHSTGIITRLNRSCFYKYSAKKQERSKEELIAEMGSLLLASECGFIDENNSYFDNSAAYINSWIKWLEKNPKEVIFGMSAAEKAVDFILDRVKEEQE